MQYCSDKDMNQLVKRMVRTGWTFERGKHGKLRYPTGIGFITFPRTPSDHRSLLNFRRDVRRLEASMPHPNAGKTSGDQNSVSVRPVSGVGRGLLG